MRQMGARILAVCAIVLCCAVSAGAGISDHVSEITIRQIWDYDRPDEPLTYEFEVEVDADANVESVSVQTSDGNSFDLSQDETYPEGQVPGWALDATYPTPEELPAFGDGNYVITVSYAGGGSDSATLFFGIPGTGNPIAQPVQEPNLIYPQHAMTDVPTSFTVEWQVCGDPNATGVRLGWEPLPQDPNIEVWVPKTDSPMLAVGTTNYGAAGLDPGTSYELDIGFYNNYFGTNDGIDYVVGKHSKTEIVFAVLPMLGDVNGDGNVDNLDITPFIYAMGNGEAAFGGCPDHS